MDATSETCWMTVLTPPGRGAIATVVIAGSGAAAVDKCWRARSGLAVAELPLGRIALGQWQGLGAEARREGSGEEVVLCRREGQIEVHCHGGRAAVARIVANLAQCGCLRRDWRECIRASEADRLRAEARIALASALTERTALILLDQANGALSRSHGELRAAIAAQDRPTALALLDGLLARAAVGLHLTRPWRVVLAGRPNAGKSSLMNALVGYERSIVFEQPGTTRDLLTALTAFEGWPVELIDTAGLRGSEDAIEREGVARAEQAIATSDLVLWVVESAESNAHPAEISPYPAKSLLVLSKCDLAPRTTLGLRTSARTGEGIDALSASIATALVPQVPQAGNAVLFSETQIESCRRLFQQIAAGDWPAANQEAFHPEA